MEDLAQTSIGNKFNWALPRDIQLIYNGTVFQNYRGVSSQLFDLLNTDVPSQFNNSVISRSASNDPDLAFTSTAKVTNWVQLPFSQVYEQLSGAHLMIRGKMIENAVVNLSLRMPTVSLPLVAGGPSGYVLHAVYAYNALLFCSMGSAEYVF